MEKQLTDEEISVIEQKIHGDHEPDTADMVEWIEKLIAKVRYLQKSNAYEPIRPD